MQQLINNSWTKEPSSNFKISVRLRTAISALALIFLLSCDKEEESNPHTPPVFVSSSPVNDAVDISIESEVEVVFNQVVTLVDGHGITINGAIAEVEVNLTTLAFDLVLEKGNEYTLIIPAGSLNGVFDDPLETDVRITFSTEAEDPVEEEVMVELTEQLVTTSPIQQTTNLYNYLLENYGKSVLSSTTAVQGDNFNEAEWVHYHTGKYPVIHNVDYLHLHWSPDNWVDYSDIDELTDWWDNNGLISATWHWNVPPNEDEDDITKFTFRPETDFKPANVPVEGTWENTVAKADFDELIGHLKQLQDKGIPVIWRPLHEAAGNIYEYDNGTAWFWWGTDGGEAYVALWRYMFDYFKANGVNNLIWVWTTQTKDADFYPGDDYVDIVGKDIYNDDDAENIGQLFTQIQAEYPNKMVTLSELGGVSTFGSQWDEGANWSYFMPWNDPDRTGNLESSAFEQTAHEYADVSWWQEALGQEYVITRDEMPSLK